MASLKQRIFIKLLIGKKNEFLHNSSWFLMHGVNLDKYIEAEYINFTHKGTIPTVTKNPTYPLNQRTRTDIPDKIKLSPYATDEFIIPKIDLQGLPYDKRKTELQDYRDAITNEITSEGIWNVSPHKDSPKTPIIDASGSASNGYKTITSEDIVKLRIALNKAYPGLKKAKWVLTLDTESYWGLSKNDDVLKGQMIYKSKMGEVNAKPVKFHDFIIEEDDRLPYYNANTGERMPYGSVPNIGVDYPCATAFVSNKTFGKAMGKTELFDNPKDSSLQADRGSLLTHAYVGPFSEDLKTNLVFMGGIFRKP